MTNYITAAEFTAITSVTWEQAGEVNSISTTIRDAKVTRAQREFEKEVTRIFTGAESDYDLAQEAVAFLAAHLIALRDLPLVSDTAHISPFLNEYKRKVALLKSSQTAYQEKIWEPSFVIIDVNDDANENRYAQE
jgi:hypothetical protein